MVIHQIKNSGGSFFYEPNIFTNLLFPPHFHRNYELVYMLSGQMEVIVDGRTALLEAGDCALCLSNEVHSYHPVTPAGIVSIQAHLLPGEKPQNVPYAKNGHTPDDAIARYFVCVFSPDFVPDFHKAMEGKTGKTCKFRLEGSVLDFFLEHILASGKQPRAAPYLQQAITSLFCGEYQRQIPIIPRDSKEYALMNAVADYIGTHFREKLTLRDVAHALGYDYYYISRLFSQIFSMNFAEYLNTCRYSAAVDGLLSTDKPITQVAMESGFQSTRTFNDVFLRKTGISPAQYRKAHTQ